MNIVFSGFKDYMLKEQLEENGYKISDITNKDTKLVIVQDIDKPITISSAKVKIALTLNIPIISKFDFLNKKLKYTLMNKF